LTRPLEFDTWQGRGACLHWIAESHLRSEHFGNLGIDPNRLSPLIRNRVAPAITVMPSRAPSSATTPLMRRAQGQSRVCFAGRFDEADLVLGHPGQRIAV